MIAATSPAKLRRLNQDSSWLLTLPTSPEYPTSTFNLVIDPWLDPAEQIDIARNFSAQRRRILAFASSLGELNTILAKESEDCVQQDGGSRPASRRIDAILLSHPFTDHLHPETIQDPSLPNDAPLLATRQAIGPLRKLLGKGRSILPIEIADMQKPPAWLEGKQENAEKALPSNFHVVQALPQERFPFWRGAVNAQWSQLHGGIIITWSSPKQDDEAAPEFNSILYSPHGITPRSIPKWLAGHTGVQRHFWAILTSLDFMTLPSWFTGIVNLGLAGASALVKGDSKQASEQAVFPAKFILDTHSERKEKSGLIACLLKHYWLGSDQLIDSIQAEKEAVRQGEAQEMFDAYPSSTQSDAQVLVLNVSDSLVLQ